MNIKRREKDLMFFFFILFDMAKDFVQPPWTYSPKEVEEWINATHGTRCKKMRVEKEKKHYLKNVEISLDLDVEKSLVKPSSHLMKWIRHLIGSNKIEEHFEVIPTAELIARDWRKRNFTTWLK